MYIYVDIYIGIDIGIEDGSWLPASSGRFSSSHHLAEEIEQYSSGDNNDSDDESVGIADKFFAIADHGYGHQGERRQSYGDRASDTSRNAKGAREFRFANPQRYQRPEFQQNAQARQQHVEDEVLFEAERITHRPQNCAGADRDPGRARAGMLPGYYPRQVAVIRHHQRQTGEGKHQGAKRSDCSDHSRERDGNGERLSADQSRDIHPAAC